jgi:hypothetical protein
MLAGPDDLPWQGAEGQPTPVTAQQSDAPAAAPESEHAPAVPPHKVPPVRTIWSRDGNIPPATAVPHPPSQQAESAPETKPAMKPAVKPEPAKPEPQQPLASEPANGDTPALPHFKIGPAPAHLGGPVDAMPLAPAPDAGTVARFKEVIAPERGRS